MTEKLTTIALLCLLGFIFLCVGQAAAFYVAIACFASAVLYYFLVTRRVLKAWAH